MEGMVEVIGMRGRVVLALQCSLVADKHVEMLAKKFFLLIHRPVPPQ